MVLIDGKDDSSSMSSVASTSTHTDISVPYPPSGSEKEAPPPYSTPQRTQEPLSACNYVHIHRSGSGSHPIGGSWLVDTSLFVPSSLLTPLEEGEVEAERAHLNLHAGRDSVFANVLLASSVATQKRAILKLSSDSKQVVLRLNTTRDQKFHLTAISKGQDVKLFIPRTFHGPLTATIKRGRLVLSPELTKNIRTTSEVKGVHRTFVGVPPTEEEEQEPWLGDEIVTGSNTHDVKISYLDEDPEVREREKEAERQRKKELERERKGKKNVLRKVFSG